MSKILFKILFYALFGILAIFLTVSNNRRHLHFTCYTFSFSSKRSLTRDNKFPYCSNNISRLLVQYLNMYLQVMFGFVRMFSGHYFFFFFSFFFFGGGGR